MIRGRHVTDTQPVEQAPPPPKFKGLFPKKRSCYGTFRDDFAGEKKEQCHTCGKYIDCIQLSYKRRRQFKLEIRRLLGLLHYRAEAISDHPSTHAA